MQDAQRPFHEDDVDASLPPAQAATKEMVAQAATAMQASQEKLPTQDHATARSCQCCRNRSSQLPSSCVIMNVAII